MMQTFFTFSVFGIILCQKKIGICFCLRPKTFFIEKTHIIIKLFGFVCRKLFLSLQSYLAKNTNSTSKKCKK